MKFLFQILLFIIAISSSVFSHKPQDITGIWLNAQQNVTVEIYENKGSFYGKVKEVVDLKDFDLDKLTETERKQKLDKVVGSLVLTELKYNSGNYINGKLTNPRTQETATCMATLAKENSELEIKISKGWISKKVTWTRVP